ncbi:MAG: hypothetical protein ACOZCK_01860 [Pseudomonadota bacterium]
MNEKQIPADLARLVKAMQQHPVGSDMRRVLANLLPDADEALTWLDRQVRRAALPVVFSFHPGYVLIGFEDEPETIPDPNLAGLSAAWEIFLHGDNAPFVFFAADRGMTPDALRIALKRAATWTEQYSMPLAVAIRAITIHKDGSASIDPAYVPPLHLGVFSAFAPAFPSLPRDSIGVSNWTKEPHHERATEDRGHCQGKSRPRADP